MIPSALPQALRWHHDELVARWLRLYEANRAAAGRAAIPIESGLIRALFEEIVSLLAASDEERIPRRHSSGAFARLAAFPDNVALCIDVFQAGSQTIGAFVVENSGPFALWASAARNGHLADLDAVFHILVHRELEALCEFRPLRPAASPEPAGFPPGPLNPRDDSGRSLHRN